MNISVFDMYRIGIGPSSSHTVGPMRAGRNFISLLRNKHLFPEVEDIKVRLMGSLAATGIGHATDSAVLLGLMGKSPSVIDVDSIPGWIQDIKEKDRLLLDSCKPIPFHYSTDLTFEPSVLDPYHTNTLIITAFDDKGKELLTRKYYSVGGGFIVEEEHFVQDAANEVSVPYPFKSATERLAYCNETGYSLSGLAMQNELALHSKKEIDEYFAHVWQTMQACIDRGMNTEGVLPGPLRVPRRASALRRMLVSSDKLSNDPMNVIDWVNMFALAVNEENAAGGRVVTAPTNGACGIVPAVLAYYDHFIESVSPDIYTRYFMAAGAIGALYKMNASISGAEVGCQGEVGVACSMAAAGLAELLGGSPEQVCVAAEIGMEHNLGLTCDPVAGQVQVPCIERNAIASVKAINAARMALRRTSAPRVSLDKVIETMYETGKDMNAKYRETSRGGLAIKVQCD